MSDIEKEAREHMRQTASIDNWPECFIVSPDVYKQEATLYLDIHKRIQEYVNTKNILVEESLDAYFNHKYGGSLDEIKGAIDRTNNFKLKGFERIVQGDHEYFYDSDTLILSVVGNIIDGFTITKVWKE